MSCLPGVIMINRLGSRVKALTQHSVKLSCICLSTSLSVYLLVTYPVLVCIYSYVSELDTCGILTAHSERRLVWASNCLICRMDLRYQFQRYILENRNSTVHSILLSTNIYQFTTVIVLFYSLKLTSMY